MTGKTMLNEEIMHARVGGMNSQYQGYTRHGNANKMLDPLWGIKDVMEIEILGGIGCQLQKNQEKKIQIRKHMLGGGTLLSMLEQEILSG